jgi:hypothetical protein
MGAIATGNIIWETYNQLMTVALAKIQVISVVPNGI